MFKELKNFKNSSFLKLKGQLLIITSITNTFSQSLQKHMNLITVKKMSSNA